MQREEEVSLSAGELIGQLYDMLAAQYHGGDEETNAHSLNVLCVRLVFCLFAEDSGLFGRDAFRNYLTGLPARSVRGALKELFRYLDTTTNGGTVSSSGAAGGAGAAGSARAAAGGVDAVPEQ